MRRNSCLYGPGFTLVELLVVISVVALLLSLLLPALAGAREKARDVMCAGTMRQTLVCVAAYNNDTKSRTGLTNYMPTCPYWTWQPDWLSDPHRLDPATSSHISQEGRSMNTYWRGYLITGGYGPSTALGCPATDYRKTNVGFVAAYNGWYGCTNLVETTPTADTLKQNPPYVWYGPGGWTSFDTEYYTGSNLMQSGGLGYIQQDYDTRVAIMTCPAVWTSSVKGTYEPTHRPNWRVTNVAVMIAMPYAKNVGFNDGSVKFFQNQNGGTFIPN